MNQYCGICRIIIPPYSLTYRCCDMDTCSIKCNNKRFEYIRSFDPDFITPIKWGTKQIYMKKNKRSVHLTSDYIMNEPMLNEPTIGKFLIKRYIMITIIPICVLVYATTFYTFSI